MESDRSSRGQAASRRDPDMDTYTLRVPDWWSRERNPLQPAADRIDRFLVALAIIVALAAAPIAAGIGTAVYDTNRRTYEQQAEHRQRVTATVTEDAARPDLRRTTTRVTIRWSWAGTEHTSPYRVASTVEPGDTVEVWVDEGGSLVGAPRSATTALLDGWVVAAATWLFVAVAATGVVAGVRALCSKHRDAEWERGLDRLMGRD